MPAVYTATGQICQITENNKISSGGEGTVYAVPEQPGAVVKIYRQTPTPETCDKLVAMLANPPAQSAADLVWPTGLAKDRYGTTIGFFMPRLPNGSLPLQKLLTPASRDLAQIRIGLESLARIAANLAIAVAHVHDSNNTSGKIRRAVGDLNESNIFATGNGLVRIIDTDSFQIGRFRCGVGKPDYTPPELQGVRFETVDRTPNHDSFALAVMIFRLLTQGQHPYVGANNPTSAADSPEQRIKNHQYPPKIDAAGGNLIISDRYKKARRSLPPALQSAFAKAFNNQGQPRPTASEWAKLLNNEIQKMVTCPDGHRKFANAVCLEGALDLNKIPQANKSPRPPKQQPNKNPAWTNPTQHPGNRKPQTPASPANNRQQPNPTANRNTGNTVPRPPTPARQPLNSGNNDKGVWRIVRNAVNDHPKHSLVTLGSFVLTAIMITEVGSPTEIVITSGIAAVSSLALIVRSW